MEEKGNLGIFLYRDKAVAVWISGDPDRAVLHRLCMTPSADEPATLALQAARAVIRQGHTFDEAFIAIDCSYYTQYSLHSEFEETRQIESTIKFDAEEAAATDAMNLAVTFEVTGILPTGSQVTTYTADRQLLTDILLDLQEGGLDPTLMEPDVVCLTRALEQTAKLSEYGDALFVVLSHSNCYLLRPNPGYAPTVRTLLVERGGDVTSTLVREVLLATASGHQDGKLKSVVLIGDIEPVDTALLYQRTGLEVLTPAPEKNLHKNSEPGTLLADYDVMDDGMTSVELLIAYGAALAGQVRGHKADFRRDFMPYQGKRKVMEGSLRLIGISLTVLLLAVAVFFQLKAFNMKGYADRLEAKTLEQFKSAMYGKAPPRAMNPSTKLRSEYNMVLAEKDGLGSGDSKSVPARLTYFLEAVNRCQKNVDIDIMQVNITERSMRIKGDTNSRTATNAMLNEIKKHNHLALGSYRYDAKPGGRDSFEITVEAKE
jgi:hypothetical protein